MRLLLDMNLTPRWVGYLTGGGHEAVHWSAVGPVQALDSSICDYARLHNLILITNDLDFPQILAHTAEGQPSVILLRGEPLILEYRSAAVLQALRDCAEELGSGAILSIDWSGKVRARLLPLK